jgi:LPXTG-motif cell wall-anchored protein
MDFLVSTRLRGLAAVAGGAAALLMAAAPLAQASAGEAPTGPPPGNKGTVKIHRPTTPDTDRRNEPKVCTFRIVGFSFPDDTHLEISIEGHGGPNAGTGSFETIVDAGDLSDAGDFAIAGPTLPNGMYKLTADNTTAPGDAKHKVFKVDCPAEVEASTGGDTGGTTGSTTGGDTGGTSTGGDTGGTTGSTTGGDTGGTTSATSGGDVSGTAAGGAAVLGETLERPASAVSPSAAVLGASTQAESLPRTGSQVDHLVVVAISLLVVGGGVLLARRRVAQA